MFCIYVYFRYLLLTIFNYRTRGFALGKWSLSVHVSVTMLACVTRALLYTLLNNFKQISELLFSKNRKYCEQRLLEFLLSAP